MSKLNVFVAFVLIALPACCWADCGYALLFDGLDDFLDCGSDSVFEPQNSLTLEAWFFLDSTYARHSIIQKLGHQDNPYGLYADDSLNAIAFGLSIAEDSIYHHHVLTTDITPYLGQWTHIAGVYDNNYMSLYLNGIISDSIPLTGDIEYFSGGNLYLGADDDNSDSVQDNIWNNKLDEIRLWNIPLTQEDIQESMYFTISGNEAGLISYWRFDEGVGDTAYDLSLNSLHANLGANIGQDDADPAWVTQASPLIPRAWHVAENGSDETGDGTVEFPFATIQIAVDLAVDLDSVLIAPGLFTGEGNCDISTCGKNLRLLGSEDGDSTIIDGENSFNGITISDQNLIVRSLTIKDIYFIDCINAIELVPVPEPLGTIKIKNCGFSNNQIAINRPKGSPTQEITSCRFSANDTVLYEYYNRMHSEKDLDEKTLSFTVEDCLFRDNEIVYTDEGFFSYSHRQINNSDFINNGIAIEGSCTIDECLLDSNNTAFYLRALDQVKIYQSQIVNSTQQIANITGSDESPGSIELDDCTIAYNTGGINGFGNEADISFKRCLYIYNRLPITMDVVDGTLQIINSDIISNDSSGISIGTYTNSIKIKNNIISNNSGYGIETCGTTFLDIFEFEYNDLYNNVSGNYDGIEDQTGINGNISADPLFLDSETNDYYLQLSSPCIDTGDPTSPLDTDSSRCDIGVYTFLHGAPDLTELISPSNGSIVDSLAILSWLKVPNPYQLDTVYYAVQIDNDTLFNDPGIAIDSIASSTTDTIQLTLSSIDTLGYFEDDVHYYWRVNAINRFGDQSGYTSRNDFYYNITADLPEPFALLAPDDDINWVDYYTYFYWSPSHDNDPLSHVNYTFQLSPDSLFSDSVTVFESLSDTSLTVITDSISSGSDIVYWRVIAIDSDSLTIQGGIPEPEVRRLRILIAGDANMDDLLIGSDVTYLVNYLRGINPPPDPLMAGDANSDCMVVGGDVIYLVQYFRGLVDRPHRADCIE